MAQDANFIGGLSRMRDLNPNDVIDRRRVERDVERVLTARGFEHIDPPALERSDLFIRKSGGEIAGNMYAFTDPGGVNVSLRPEFTPSIIRWHIENARPSVIADKYRYCGPVFRYGEGARFRQFHQAGAELIGDAGRQGDADILRAAVACLESADAGDFRIRIGHVGIVGDIADALGLSERMRMFILSNLGEIGKSGADEDGRERLFRKAAVSGLALTERDDDGGQSATASLSQHSDAAALDALSESISGPVGRRSAERILSRLAMRRNQAASADDFRAAVGHVARLASCATDWARNVSVQDAIARAKTVLEDCGASTHALTELEYTLASVLRAREIEESIDLDFSFARGLAYYTGVVFEFTVVGGEYPLGGGGRYDDLVKAFGGDDSPACGFALDLDELSLIARARYEARAARWEAEYLEAKRQEAEARR